MQYIENKTFNEIRIGDSASLTRTLSKPDIELFALMSGDVNPTHLDEHFAGSDVFHKVVAHGMWGGALISAVLGTQLPGPGTVYVRQDLRFRRPVGVGETLTVTVTATAKDESTRQITFDCRCANQEGVVVTTGTAEVIAPGEKIRHPRAALPTVHVYRDFVHHRKLLAATQGLAPAVAAVAHPCDAESLSGAVEAAKANLIVPVLVGPEEKIREVASAAGIDISPYTLVPASHSHDAAEKAVALIRTGKAEILMKGSLHTGELMAEVVQKSNGLRTSRRMSHVFVMDVPSYPRLLLITDAAINIAPTLAEKRDIVQNAIELGHALGVPAPKVAILSAIETVNPDLRSTTDAAALCKMADRGQITGGILDGPLAFDNAVSEAAARTKGIASPVAGSADILVVPDSNRETCSRSSCNIWPNPRRRGCARRQRSDCAHQPRRHGVDADDVHGGRPPARAPAADRPAMNRAIIVINSGSSSIKFGIYALAASPDPELVVSRQVEGIDLASRLPAEAVVS